MGYRNLCVADRMPTARHKRRLRIERHHRKTRRRQRGGALDCSVFLANDDLMKATYGRNYTALHARGKTTGELHSTGERQSFATLNEFSKYGIMEWYSRQLNTKDKWDELTDKEDVQTLGAFFHRFKIVLEKLLILLDLLQLGMNFFIPNLESMSELVIKKAVEKFEFHLKRHEDKYDYPIEIKELFSNILHGRQDISHIGKSMYKIEGAMNKVQCLMYQTMKDGKLPDGFVMDERIKTLAEKEIHVSSHKEQGPPPIHLRYDYCVGWLSYLKDFEELYGDAPLTFGATFAK